jgi:hypothetical protein
MAVKEGKTVKTVPVKAQKKGSNAPGKKSTGNTTKKATNEGKRNVKATTAKVKATAAPKSTIFFSDAQKQKALAKTVKPIAKTNANSRPSSAGSGTVIKRLGSNKTATKVAITTAECIASSRDHPKRKEVKELLQSFEKGWVNFDKFTSILQGLVF